MVSNVLKPAASSRMPATNGTTATSNGGTIAKVGGGKYNLGADRKTLKKLRRNGIVNGCGHHVSPSPPPSTPPPPPTLMGNQTKTKGAHSNEEGGSSTSIGDQSQHRRLVCPELAITYTGTVMSKRAGDLVGNQRKLESQLTSLSRKLREKQLKTVLTHARRQLNFRDEATAASSSITQHDTKQTNLLGSLDLTKSDSESSDASNDVIRVDKHEAMDTEISSKEICEHALPIQVDGASNERSSLASLSLDRPVVAASNDLGERFKAPYHSTVTRTDSKDDVFRENSSENAAILAERRAKSSQSRLNGSMRLIQQQLASLKSLMDDDVTDSSSDEEEESGQVSRYVHECGALSLSLSFSFSLSLSLSLSPSLSLSLPPSLSLPLPPSPPSLSLWHSYLLHRLITLPYCIGTFVSIIIIQFCCNNILTLLHTYMYMYLVCICISWNCIC